LDINQEREFGYEGYQGMLELVRQLALTIESPVWEAVRAPAPWKIKTSSLVNRENEIVNTADLSSTKPSPEGEGWVRGNSNKEESLFNPPHPSLLPEGEGAVRTIESTVLQ
jgi:hypothetical protein